MNDIFTAMILGFVEGVTEFLPISSTGHLILVNQWFAFDSAFTKMFDVVIQLGAILAVVIFFRKQLCFCTAPKEKRPEVFDLWKKMLMGVLPAIVLGALFGSAIESRLFNSTTVAIALILGGVVLVLMERRTHTVRFSSIASLNMATVFAIGLFQTLAMIPGTSRSAATIIGAMLLGASRSVAAEFSFFLAIPTILAASVYTLYASWSSLSINQFAILATGFLTAFIVAFVVIALFMKFIRSHRLTIFGYYRIALGILVLLSLL